MPRFFLESKPCGCDTSTFAHGEDVMEEEASIVCVSKKPRPYQRRFSGSCRLLCVLFEVRAE